MNCTVSADGHAVVPEVVNAAASKGTRYLTALSWAPMLPVEFTSAIAQIVFQLSAFQLSNPDGPLKVPNAMQWRFVLIIRVARTTK
jgi:hypothetical protein